MAASTPKPGDGTELIRVFGALSSAIGETIGSLLGHELATTPGETRVLDAGELLTSLKRPCAVACGHFGEALPHRSFAVLFEVQDAAAMVGLLMLSPAEVIEQRRSEARLDGDDMVAFGELGGVMLSAVGTTVGDGSEVALVRHGVTTPGATPGATQDSLVGSGALVVHSFTARLGEHPPTTAFLVVDLATATAWNKGPLPKLDGDPWPTARGDDAALDAIPEAPILGALAAYVSQPEVLRTLRQCCRRVGLELRRHGKGEIPNPAAHRQEIVVVDVPSGDDRQFDWCRRLKEFPSGIRVVLLLHHPSRNRVAQAFMSQADVILGFPCDELQLSQKLAALIESAPTPQE